MSSLMSQLMSLIDSRQRSVLHMLLVSQVQIAMVQGMPEQVDILYHFSVHAILLVMVLVVSLQLVGPVVVATLPGRVVRDHD